MVRITRAIEFSSSLRYEHPDLSPEENRDERNVLEETDREVKFSAAVREHMEISEKNIDSFHFHGDPATYPLSAVIAVPHDEKSRVLLLGRHQSDEAIQMVRPVTVMNE